MKKVIKKAQKKNLSNKKQQKWHPILKWINANQISVGHPVTYKELLNR